MVFLPRIQSLLAVVLLVFATPLIALTSSAVGTGWKSAFTVLGLPDGSFLVAQHSGQVDRFMVEDPAFQPVSPWADLGEGGKYSLRGLIADPDFLATGYLFATQSYHDGPKVLLRLTRWRVTEDKVVLNRILVDDLPSGLDRPGGVLKWGPDGKLWLGLGDGGAVAADVKPETLRGTLLRYNPDGSVPVDNPDPTSPVWAWGFREPAGLAWQPGTDRLYSLDRGAPVTRGTMDEVNLIEKNGFYGWPKYLGREVAKGVIKPVIYCTSGHTWVPGGATFVPSGEWKGSLLFAGAGEGVLYRLSLDPNAPTKILFYEELINGSLGPLVDVATIGDGLYLLSATTLYRITP